MSQNRFGGFGGNGGYNGGAIGNPPSQTQPSWNQPNPQNYGGQQNYGNPNGAYEQFGVPGGLQNTNPGTGPGGINAGTLHPYSRRDGHANGEIWERTPIYPPFAKMNQNCVYQPKTYTLIFGGNAVAAGVQLAQQLRFSNRPVIVYGRTAQAWLADGADLPVGRTEGTIWKSRINRTGQITDLIDVVPNSTSAQVAGGCLFGVAGLPNLFAGNGLFFDTGYWMDVEVQTLIDNVEVHITFFTIEEYGVMPPG